MFEAGLREVAEAMLQGPRSRHTPRDHDAACAALAALIGAVTLGRAVHSAELSARVAASVGRALLGDDWDAGGASGS